MTMRQFFCGKKIDRSAQYAEALKTKERGEDCEFHDHSSQDALCIPETTEASINWCWTTKKT